MKILTIITGGTIGSTTSGSTTSLDESKNYALINEYENKFQSGIDFTVVSPYRILSENITANELNLLINCVAENLEKDYDGIIVTHGTDTLQYTASALGFCFSGVKIPIVLVSANYPLDNENGNGHKNFEAAVKFIESGVSNGVFVSYKNTHNDYTDIHLATRLYSHLEITDEVYSIRNQVFAFYKNGKIEKNDKFVATTKKSENTLYHFENKTGILVISSLVGDSFNYDLSDAKAVLIRPYHSGTINTADGGLERFCKKAKEMDVPVFILSNGMGADYESTNVFKQYNIEKLPFSTFISQYMKLWIATSNGIDVKEFMKNELAGEFCRE